MKKYDGVLKRVKDLEEKKGIVYAKVGGKLYSTLNVLYIISGIWTLIMNLLFITGFLLLYSGKENFSEVKSFIIAVSVATALIIVGYILKRFKLNLTGGIISLVPLVFLIPLFASISKDATVVLGFKLYFYWRHLIPLLLMIIFIVWMTVIALRERIKLNRQYKKVVENLFAMYSQKIEDGSEITEEQWENFLKEYDPDFKNERIKNNSSN